MQGEGARTRRPRASARFPTGRRAPRCVATYLPSVEPEAPQLGHRIRPFHRGDRISVAGAEGVVSEIDLRYTTLVVDEGTRVLVPNSTLFTNSIRVERREGGPTARP